MTKPTSIPGPSFLIKATHPRAFAVLDSLRNVLLSRTVGVMGDPQDGPPHLRALDKACSDFADYRGPEAGAPDWLLEASKPNAAALTGWADDLRIRSEGTEEFRSLVRATAAQMREFLAHATAEPPKARPVVDSLKAAVARLAEYGCTCKPDQTCPDHVIVYAARDAKLRENARRIEAANRREREAARKIEDPHLVAKRARREQEQAARRAEFASKPAVTVHGVPGAGDVAVFYDQEEVWQAQDAMKATGDLVQFVYRWKTETGSASYVSDLHLAEVNRLLAALRSVGAVKDGGDVGKQEFSPAWVNRGGEFFHESGKADASGGAAFVTISEAR